MKKIAVVMMIFMLLTGCSGDSQSSSQVQDSVASNAADKGSQQGEMNVVEIWEFVDKNDAPNSIPYMTFDEKYEIYKETYPDKEILIWIVDGTIQYEWWLNEYLADNNYEYVICFRPLSEEQGMRTKTDVDMAEELIDSGEYFDILGRVSSFGDEDMCDPISSTYYYFAQQGVYEPLDEYLEMEEYADIKNSMPQKYWDSYKYNGKIYGVYPFVTLCGNSGLRIYNDVLEQTGFGFEDFNKPLSELEPVLKEIYDKTGKRVYYYSSVLNSDIFIGNSIGLEGLVISDGRVVNGFELPEFADYYKTLDSMAQQGFITIDKYDESDESDDVAGIPVLHSAAYGETIVNEANNTTTFITKQNNYIGSPGGANGVNAKSENKEMAVDALLNLFYNAELNNIITYGVEGVHYEIVDGNVVMQNDNSIDVEGLGIDMEGAGDLKYGVDTSFNNPMISLPYSGANTEIITRDYYSAYETAEYLDGFGFLFDGSEVHDSFSKVLGVIMSFEPSQEDIEAYLEAFNAELYDAGLQDILDEANRQLEVYNNEENS